MNCYTATSLPRQQVLCPVCKAGWLVQEGSVVLCDSISTTSTSIGENSSGEDTSCSFQLDTGSYDAQLEVIRRVRLVTVMIVYTFLLVLSVYCMLLGNGLR
jgi:hypothetical protein